jgi:uncharacterized short protein YbdD (DUF466 family)
MTYLKFFWSWLRRLAGEDAYDLYVAHVRSAHPECVPQDRATFFRQREIEKWNGVKRCC